MDSFENLGAGKVLVVKPDLEGGLRYFAGGADITNMIRYQHLYPIRIADRLYEIFYEDYDYRDVDRFISNYRPGACSAIRKGDYVGGNLDWYYGEEVNAVIHTRAIKGRHATIGVVGGVPGFTNELANSGRYDDIYAVLPAMANDVINDCGVYAKVNVVWAGDKGLTMGTNPGAEDLCSLIIPRYVCDYASTAAEAVDILRSKNIFAPVGQIGSEIHAMICDETETYIVEFVNNQMVVLSGDDIPNELPIMTNFYLSGWNGQIKTVYGGDTEAEVAATGLTKHAMGLERYDILADQYESMSGLIGMLDLLRDVRYTNSYSKSVSPAWMSEFVTSGEGPWGELTIYSGTDDFEPIMDYYADIFQNRERDKQTWYTTHTAVYDIPNRTIHLHVEEDFENEYTFEL